MRNLKKYRLLHIEDDREVSKICSEILSELGYEIDIAENGKIGVDLFDNAHFDAVLLDYKLPDITGIKLAETILSKSPDTPIIFITGKGSEKIAAKALEIGVSHYIIKESLDTFTNVLPSVLKRVISQNEANRNLQKRQIELIENEKLLLQENAIRFREFGQIAASWFWEMDENLTFTYLSNDFETRTGLPIDEVLGKKRSDLRPPEISDEIWQAHIEMLENHQPFKNFTHTRVNQNRETIWISSSGVPIFDEKQKFLGYRCVGQDITEYKNIELDLAKSEARFKGFAEAGGDRFWETDEEHRYSYASPPTGLMQKPSEDLIGLNPWKVALPEVMADYAETMEATFKSKKAFRNLRNIGVTKDGITRYMYLNGIPIYDDNNNFIGFRGSTTDETDIVETEKQAEATQRQFIEAIENLPIGIFLWGANNTLITVNQYALNLYSEIAHVFTIGQAQRNVFEAFMSIGRFGGESKSIEECVADYEAALNVEVSENTIDLKDGRHILIRKHQMEDGSFLALHIDETQKTMAAKALAESERKNRDLLTATQEGYWNIDLDGITIDVNAAMCKILDRPREEIIGKRIFDFVDEENAQIFHNQIAMRKPGKPGRYEIELSRPDGTKVACINNATPVFDINGTSTGSIGLWSDITELKSTLSELQEAKAVADRANYAKSEFLSSMSHELRTPMNAILGFGQLLENFPGEELSQRQQDYVKQILKSGDHLLDLIDQVLELSKIEAGKASFSIENVAPKSCIDDCLNMVRMLAKDREITLNFTQPDFQMPLLRTDINRFNQVLLNLLSNAIKYNKEGGEVSVSITQVHPNFLRTSVTDTGFGIPLDQQERIFEPFNRLGRESGEIEGTGIGLTITKEMVDLLGGFIGFESEENVGSVFWIDIPISSKEVLVNIPNLNNGTDQNTTRAISTSGHILYIEDNPANIRLMEAIIQRLPNLSLKSVHTAELGLEIARDTNPNIILMDINLPGMDGIDALKKLREDDLTRDIPVIAISAAAMEHEIKRGKAAGFEDYLTKPIKVPEVLAAINEFIS